MGNLHHHFDTIDIHPIDIVETLAHHRDWEFDRVAEDQIAMAIEGAWKTYSITLAWSPSDETLRLICSFEMSPPDDRLPVLYDVLNRANEKCWTGAFTLWRDHNLMVYRYGLCLAGGEIAGTSQIDALVQSAVMTCERFYPSFQLVVWGDDTPKSAIEIALGNVYGTA